MALQPYRLSVAAAPVSLSLPPLSSLSLSPPPPPLSSLLLRWRCRPTVYQLQHRWLKRHWGRVGLCGEKETTSLSSMALRPHSSISCSPTVQLKTTRFLTLCLPPSLPSPIPAAPSPTRARQWHFCRMPPRRGRPRILGTPASAAASPPPYPPPSLSPPFPLPPPPHPPRTHTTHTHTADPTPQYASIRCSPHCPAEHQQVYGFLREHQV